MIKSLSFSLKTSTMFRGVLKTISFQNWMQTLAETKKKLVLGPKKSRNCSSELNNMRSPHPQHVGGLTTHRSVGKTQRHPLSFISSSSSSTCSLGSTMPLRCFAFHPVLPVQWHKHSADGIEESDNIYIYGPGGLHFLNIQNTMKLKVIKAHWSTTNL